MKNPQKQIAALEKRLKQLESAYQDEKLKREVYEIMIRIAEEELDIPIRKKYGAKQLRKLDGNTP